MLKKKGEKNMKCPNCTTELKKISISIHGAQQKAISFQCPKCAHFSFDQESSKKVIEELNETPLKIKQKIVKLSSDRLGIYFNSHIVRSLNLKSGDDIYLSIPSKKKILLEIRIGEDIAKT